VPKAPNPNPNPNPNRDCAKGPDGNRLTCKAENARYRPSGGGAAVPCLCCMSLMKVMDLVARMGYDEVYLLGFDGFSESYGGYFFQDPDLHPAEAAAWNRATRAGVETRGKPPQGWGMDTGGNVFLERAPGVEGERKHGRNGYEHVLVAFAAYNGIRLVNLSPKSTLGAFVYTPSLPEALAALEGDARGN
jgi:hypothetical protein